MRISKRSFWGFAGLATLVAGGVFALLVAVGGVGQSAVEAWVGEQLIQVADDHLVPDLRFDTMDYQAPRTLVLTNVRLTADDPDAPGQSVDVIDAERIRIELAELPRRGKPLKLSKIELDHPSVRLIESTQGGLVGLSDFVQAKESDGDGPALSEVLQITEIVINNGEIEYDARSPGTEPMRFDAIDTVVLIDPTDPAGYGLDLKLSSNDLLDITMAGSCNLDAMQLTVDSLKTSLLVAREQDRYLPPQVQGFIKRHQLTGQLTLSGSGVLVLDQVADSQADITLRLSDAHGSAGGYRLPIDVLEIEAAMAGRRISIGRFVGVLLSGEISGDGALALSDEVPATLRLSGNGLRLGQLLVDDETGAAPRIAGKVDLQVNAETPLNDALNQMSGYGELRLSEGRVARLALISDMIEFMESAGDITRRDDAPQGRDEAQVIFELRGDHAYLSKAEIEGSWFAMRGRGKVFFSDKLAIHVNAGPMEKVQNALGAIGRPLAAITDGLLAYRVSGAYSDLKIQPVPLAGIIGAPGDDE